MIIQEVDHMYIGLIIEIKHMNLIDKIKQNLLYKIN